MKSASCIEPLLKKPFTLKEQQGKMVGIACKPILVDPIKMEIEKLRAENTVLAKRLGDVEKSLKTACEQIRFLNDFVEHLNFVERSNQMSVIDDYDDEVSYEKYEEYDSEVEDLKRILASLE